MRVAIFIGITLILIWAVIFPLLVLLVLYRNRDRLSNTYILKVFGLFYVGLTDKSYYWEITIVNFRKFVFIIVGSLLQDDQSHYKVL